MRREREPPKFNGHIDLSDYLQQFQIVSVWNRWTIEEMGLQLAMSLTGEATEILGTLGPNYSADYASLVKALRDRYDHEGRSYQHAMAFLNVSCQSEQDISSYGHEVRRLAYKAYPGIPMDERILVDIFVKGLPGQDIRRHVYLSRPKTLSEAISLGVSFETIEQLTTPAYKPKQSVQPQGDDFMALLKAIQELLQGKEKREKEKVTDCENDQVIADDKDDFIDYCEDDFLYYSYGVDEMEEEDKVKAKGENDGAEGGEEVTVNDDDSEKLRDDNGVAAQEVNNIDDVGDIDADDAVGGGDIDDIEDVHDADNADGVDQFEYDDVYQIDEVDRVDDIEENESNDVVEEKDDIEENESNDVVEEKDDIEEDENNNIVEESDDYQESDDDEKKKEKEEEEEKEKHVEEEKKEKEKEVEEEEENGDGTGDHREDLVVFRGRPPDRGLLPWTSQDLELITGSALDGPIDPEPPPWPSVFPLSRPVEPGNRRR